jgi:hypothetical protein
LIFLKVGNARICDPGWVVIQPACGSREDFYSVERRQEINNSNNNSTRRGSAKERSAAERPVA